MNSNQPNPTQPLSNQARRTIVLVLSIVLIAGALAAWQFGSSSWAKFVTAGMGRIGIVLAALWLAWPSLQRPASWLPPGIAVACVLGLVVLAANPKWVVFVIPTIGLLTALGVLMRFTRS